MRSRTLLALLLCTPPAHAADAALQAVFQRMDNAAATFKGCTADLVKIDHYAIIDTGDEKQNGTIAVRKPNPRTLQLLEKFVPDGEQIELKDTHVQIYHPRTNLLQFDDIGKKYHGLVEEVLLVGLGGTSKDLLEGYQVSLGGSETAGGQAATRLILIPKDSQLAQQFPKFEVWYSDTTGIAVQQKWYQKGYADYSVQTYTHMKIGPVTEAQVNLVLPKDVHREHLIH
jgi:outer membrane lipoprotein-sorting protein